MSNSKKFLGNFKYRLEKSYNQLENNLSRNKKIFELENSNFVNGSIIIDNNWIIIAKNGQTEKIMGSTNGYIFKLKENISFNPNSLKQIASDLNNPTGNEIARAGRVKKDQHNFYNQRAFGIGFFAAIVLQANNVVIDLNGYTIEQSFEHSIQQRFFSVIELASIPFLPTQGPHTFGKSIKAAENCLIHNGTIGRSSHHGIHGNLSTNIIIKDLKFENYEVGSISLNGVRNIYIDNIVAAGHSINVPVLGIFSSARFIWEYVEELRKSNSKTTLNLESKILTVQDVITNLENSLKKTYIDIIDPNTGEYIEESSVTDLLYKNEKKLVDGNSYGILINQIGVAVHGFPKNRNEPSENIYLSDVKIKNHIAWVNEIPALENPEGGHEKDPIGAVFQTQNGNHTMDKNGKYKGNVVSNSQLIITKAIKNNDFFFGMEAKNCHCLKRNSISHRTLNWAESGRSLLNEKINYIFNGDSMFHVNKGLISFKLDAVDGLVAENCVSAITKNVTDKYAECLESLTCWNIPEEYKQNYKLYANSLSLAMKGATYKGCNVHSVRSWSLASSKNCYLINCTSRNIESFLGRAFAYDIHQDSDNIYLLNCSVYNVIAGSKIDDICLLIERKMMENPKSIGFRIGRIPNNITLDNCIVDGKNEAYYDDWVKHYEVLSRRVNICNTF